VAARFPADESCDFAAVRALCAANFDVVAVVEHSPGATDDQVIARSVKEQRVLLTEDKDFGELVFTANRESAGVIFVRFPASARGTRVPEAEVGEAGIAAGCRARAAGRTSGPARGRRAALRPQPRALRAHLPAAGRSLVRVR
jgi:hypothetical protein